MTAGEQPGEDEDPGEQFEPCQQQPRRESQMAAPAVLLCDRKAKPPTAAVRERFLFGMWSGVEDDVADNTAKQRCGRMRRNGSDERSDE